MIQAASGILKIIIFLAIGVLFRRSGILKDREIAGVKKIVLYLAIPSVLFLSFSSLKFDLSFIPVTAVVFSINLILFWLGVLIYKLTGSKNRILPLTFCTMNFSLIGIPLYEAVFGVENLHFYTLLGVGNEIFIWIVFYFLFRWFLSKGTAEKKINTGFLKSPVIWGLLLGCAFSIFNIDISSSENFIVSGIYQSITGLSKITSPLILLFIGFNISLSPDHLKQSIKLTLMRLILAFSLGYALKFIVIDRFVPGSVYFDAAFFC